MAAILGVASGRGSPRRLPPTFTPALTFAADSPRKKNPLSLYGGPLNWLRCGRERLDTICHAQKELFPAGCSFFNEPLLSLLCWHSKVFEGYKFPSFFHFRRSNCLHKILLKHVCTGCAHLPSILSSFIVRNFHYDRLLVKDAAARSLYC